MYKIDLKLIIPNSLFIAVFIGSVLLCLTASMVSFRKVAAIDPALVFRT
jgi:putative ABC transport system permease protein